MEFSNLTWQKCFQCPFVGWVKFNSALQVPLAPFAFLEHVVLTPNPLVKHFTAPSDFEPFCNRSFRF